MTEPRARLRIVMDRPFETFDDAAQAEFVHDLCEILGCQEEDIGEVQLRRGCVVYEATFPAGAVSRALDLHSNARIPSDSRELAAYNGFKGKHSVARVSDTEPRFHVPPRRMRPPRQIILVPSGKVTRDSFGKLPAFLAHAFQCSASAYSYPKHTWKKPRSLNWLARSLETWVNVNVAAEEMAFISHSLGGVVTRQFLVNQKDMDTSLTSRVRQVTLVASPRGGPAFESIARRVLRLGREQIEAICEGDRDLPKLNVAWDGWASTMSRWCTVRGLYGAKDAYVDSDAAKCLDPAAVPVPDADHESVARPQRPDDPTVVTIRGFLVEAGFGGHGRVAS